MTMAPELRTLLEETGDLELVMIAGADGLDRRVASARLATDGRITDMHRHALLVLAGQQLVDEGRDLIEAAVHHDVAGLVAVDPTDVPIGALEAANDARLPVVVTRGGIDPASLVIALLERIITHQRASSDALEDRFATITLEELVSSDPHRTLEAMERGAHLGWDLHRSRAVLLASIDPPVAPEAAHRVLPTIAAAARATLGDAAIVWMRATSVAALLAPPDASAAARRSLADALRAELDQAVRSVTLSIGVGRCTDDPTQLNTSFIDANRAVDVGRWAKGRHVTELYDELGLERLFAAVEQQDLHDFVLHAIGPLIEHDRRQGSDLVETLSTWLRNRNIAKAARQMFVHYNTFKNRLERIEDILGPVLTDPGRLLECEVAIYVSEHYDGPWKPRPSGLVQ